MKKIIIIIIIFLHALIVNGQPETAYYVPTGSSTYTGSSSSACTALSSPLPCWYLNLEKYWYYRYKLVNDFMLIGPDAGMSIPVYMRDLRDAYINHHDYGNYFSCLNFSSDATIDIGHYIGMLALEYKQLANNGFNTDRTLYELTYAQNALKRLTNNSGYYQNAMISGGGLRCCVFQKSRDDYNYNDHLGSPHYCIIYPLVKGS